MAKVVKKGFDVEVILEVGSEWWKGGSQVPVEEYSKERDTQWVER